MPRDEGAARTEIYTIDIDGSDHDHQRLTADNSARDDNHESFIMNSDGSGQTRLTDNTVDDG